MKRVGLLAGLVALVLGTGVVAQEPSPEASPLYAPDDMTLALPSRIGEYVVVVRDVPLDPEEREMWRDLLLPFGKEPSDVRQVFAYADPTEADEPLSDNDVAFRAGVFRVDGVPAASWLDAFITDFLSVGEGWDDYAYDEMGWRVVDGREVYFAPQEYAGREGGNEDRGFWFYPKGEVLFYIYRTKYPVTELTIEDVLAELP